MVSNSITEIAVGVADLTRLRRITRLIPHARGRSEGEVACWQLWTDTRNFDYGTYLLLYDNGRVERWTERADEGPEMWLIKPED